MKKFNIGKGIAIFCLALISGTVLVTGGNLLTKTLLRSTETQYLDTLDEYSMPGTSLAGATSNSSSISHQITNPDYFE